MKEEDWDELKAEIEQQAQQKGPQGAQGQPPGGQPPQGGQPQQGQEQISPEQLQEALSKIPPGIKQQVVEAIQQGMEPMEAVKAGMQQAAGASGGAVQ
jgi:hypothetical protein